MLRAAATVFCSALLAALVSGVFAAEPGSRVWLAGAPGGSESRTPVVLAQSWASWCHSCVGIAPALADLARQYPQARYEATSVDERLDDARAAAAAVADASGGRAVVSWGGPGYAEGARLTTVPTLRVLFNGHELARVEGHPNARELAQIGAALAQATGEAGR